MQIARRALTAILVLLFAASAYGLTVEQNSTRENDDDVTVFFTVTDDAGNTYEWHGDFQKGVDIDTQLEAQKEKLYTLILKKMYSGAKPEKAEGETDLEAMERWVSEGATNPAVMGEDEEGNPIVVEEAETITQQDHESTHPGTTLEDRIAELEAQIEALAGP